MRILGRIFWLVALFTLGGSVAQGIFAQDISLISPFLPHNGTAGAATVNSPLELRGIMALPGGAMFGLFDPMQKKGGWVKLNEAGRDFLVRSYDAANDVVTVEYQGRVLNLPLTQPKIEKLPAMAIAGGPVRAMMTTGPQQAVSAPISDDAKRIEAVAAEVARRRQARQAASQQQQ